MKYKVTLNFPEKQESNVEHNCNDYDQAKHFFWAIVNKMYKEQYPEAFELIFYDVDGKINSSLIKG